MFSALKKVQMVKFLRFPLSSLSTASDSEIAVRVNNRDS